MRKACRHQPRSSNCKITSYYLKTKIWTYRLDKKKMKEEKRQQGIMQRTRLADKVNVKLAVMSSVFLVLVMLTILSIPGISAGYTRTNFYSPLGGIGSFTGGFFGQTPGQFDRSMCEAGQDFVLHISPFGCSPAVVRSD